MENATHGFRAFNHRATRSRYVFAYVSYAFFNVFYVFHVSVYESSYVPCVL